MNSRSHYSVSDPWSTGDRHVQFEPLFTGSPTFAGFMADLLIVGLTTLTTLLCIYVFLRLVAMAISWWMRGEQTDSGRTPDAVRAFRSIRIDARVQQKGAHAAVRSDRTAFVAACNDWAFRTRTTLLPLTIKAQLQHWYQQGNTDAYVLLDAELSKERLYAYGGDGKPLLLNAFQPEKLAYSDQEISWTPDEDSNFHFLVRGGNLYVQPMVGLTAEYTYIDLPSFYWLWAWSPSTYDWVSDRFGLTWLLYRRQHYWHTSKRLRKDSPFVATLLYPMQRPEVTNEHILPYMSHDVIRTVPGTDKKIALLHGPNKVSICVPGSYHACTIPTTKFDSKLADAYTKRGFQPSAATREGICQPVDAELVCAAWSAFKGDSCIISNGGIVVDYDQTGLQGGKPLMTEIAGPFTDEHLTNVIRNKALVKQSVKGRVTDIRDRVLTEEDPRIYEYAREFAGELHLHLGDLHLTDLDDVESRQNTARKKAIYWEALALIQGYTTSFLKGEGVKYGGDPRNITIQNNTDKIESALISYPLGDALKDLRWYAFGKSPRVLTEQIGTWCSNYDIVYGTDYSRWDAHVTTRLRECQRIIVAKLFGSEIGDRFVSLVTNKTVTSRDGVSYDSGPTQMSGDMFTSSINTLSNALIDYTSHRLAGRSIDEAWDALGFYGGDDGLTTAPPDARQQAVAMYCMNATNEVFKRGEPVQMLGRYFGPEVWEGPHGISTCCDIPRQLSKLHLSSNNDPTVTNVEKMRRKLAGFWYTDRNTPVIGDLVRGAFGPDGPGSTLIDSSKTRYHEGYFEASECFPNALGEWMHDIIDVQLYNLEACATILTHLNRNGEVFKAKLAAKKPAVPVTRIEQGVQTQDDPLTPGTRKCLLNVHNTIRVVGLEGVQEILYIGGWNPVGVFKLRDQLDQKVRLRIWDPRIPIEVVRGKKTPNLVFNRSAYKGKYKLTCKTLVIDDALKNEDEREKQMLTSKQWFEALREDERLHAYCFKVPRIAITSSISLYDGQMFRVPKHESVIRDMQSPVSEARLVVRRDAKARTYTVDDYNQSPVMKCNASFLDLGTTQLPKEPCHFMEGCRLKTIGHLTGKTKKELKDHWKECDGCDAPNCRRCPDGCSCSTPASPKARDTDRRPSAARPAQAEAPEKEEEKEEDPEKANHPDVPVETPLIADEDEEQAEVVQLPSGHVLIISEDGQLPTHVPPSASPKKRRARKPKPKPQAPPAAPAKSTAARTSPEPTEAATQRKSRVSARGTRTRGTEDAPAQKQSRAARGKQAGRSTVKPAASSRNPPGDVKAGERAGRGPRAQGRPS